MLFIFDMKGTLHPKNSAVDSSEDSYRGDNSILPDLFNPLQEDLISVLAEMKDKIHVATGGRNPWRSDVVRHLGLSEIITNESIHFLEKKSLEEWQTLIRELNHAPEHIYVIGDSLEYDINPPKEAGCKTVWVRPAADKSGRADFEVTSLEEAVYLLKSLDLKWNFRKTAECKEDLTGIVAKVIDVFNDGMKQGEWKPHNVKRQLNSSHILGLLEDERGNAYSYFFATIPKQRFNGRHLLWIDACSVRQKFQKYGHFLKGIEVIKTIYTQYDFGYVGGRSQNPIVFRTLDKLSSNPYYPFDKLYTPEIIAFLKSTIKNEVKRPSENTSQGLNVENGIVTNAYWHKKLGDYKVDLNNDGILGYEKKLSKWNFDRCNGDAVVLFKEL